jgi:anti-sigma B factor antagonist
MSLVLENKEGVGRITLSGALDASTAETFRQQTGTWLDSLPLLKQIVVDLGAVNFMDSAGLGTLIGLRKQVASRDGDLRLARLRPNVKLVLEITRANKIFTLFETVEEALKSAE